MPLIALKKLYKQYESEAGLITPVIRGMDLTIQSGEFIAIMGPSGSGKSTLMNILGCLDTPTSGDYLLEGKSIGTLDENALASVRNHMLGFVFQGFNLLPRRDALSNVMLPMLYAGIGNDESRERAKELLAKVGIVHLAHSLPTQMSGGQQQRVAIARALANNPRVILADEPTGNLDTATSREIMALFKDLNRSGKITIILVTHEPDIAREAKRLVHCKDGVITYDGSVHGYKEESL